MARQFQIGPSLASNVIIHHQNYHDITNYTNLTTFTLYKILRACIIRVNTQIIKLNNKDLGSKNLSPQKLPLQAMTHFGPCVNTVLVVLVYYLTTTISTAKVRDRRRH